MTKCSDIAKHIEALAPCNLACDWDNVGLLVGDMNKEVKRVLVALDNDEAITNEAIALGADMIVSHHPIMFSPVRRITEDEPQQRMLRRLCESGICHYAAHTNMDCAIGGLNDYLAQKLGLENAAVFAFGEHGAGFGRISELKEEKSLSELLELCREKLKSEGLRYVGALDKKITTVAVNSGSGGDILGDCIKRDVDLLITGDVKYTLAREAYENGICVIDAGHYGTEIIFVEMITAYLEKEFKEVEFIASRANVPVLKTY